MGQRWMYLYWHILLAAAQEQTAEHRFLHVFIEDGSPVAQLCCGGGVLLSAATDQNIDWDRWMNITVRYDVFNLLQLCCVVTV